MLRRFFGISAHEAEHVIPAWEIDNCLRGFAREIGVDQGSARPAVADPFSVVPSDLQRLL